eukprot:COSAG06_NODE_37579_length_433_cov_1.341317_1_plen_22_part_10
MPSGGEVVVSQEPQVAQNIGRS